MADTHLTIPGQWDDAEPSDSRSIKSAVSSTETVTPIQQPASDQSFNLPPALSSQPQGRKTTSPHPANASSDVSSIKWKCPECEHRSPMNPNPCETCRLKWRRDAPLDPEASKHRDLMVVPQDHGSSIDFFTTISNHKARKAAREAANSRVEQSSTEQQIKGKGKGNAPSGVSDADSQMDDGDDAEPKTWEEKGKWVPGRASDPNVARSSNTPVALHGSDNSNESDIPDVAVNLRTNWRGSEDQEVDLAYLDGVSRLFGRDSVDVANVVDIDGRSSSSITLEVWTYLHERFPSIIGPVLPHPSPGHPYPGNAIRSTISSFYKACTSPAEYLMTPIMMIFAATAKASEGRNALPAAAALLCEQSTILYGIICSPPTKAPQSSSRPDKYPYTIFEGQRGFDGESAYTEVLSFNHVGPETQIIRICSNPVHTGVRSLVFTGDPANAKKPMTLRRKGEERNTVAADIGHFDEFTSFVGALRDDKKGLLVSLELRNDLTQGFLAWTAVDPSALEAGDGEEDGKDIFEVVEDSIEYWKFDPIEIEDDAKTIKCSATSDKGGAQRHDRGGRGRKMKLKKRLLAAAKSIVT